MKIINELDIRNMIRAVLLESRDIPWDVIDPLLGTMSDPAVARKIGHLMNYALYTATSFIRKRRIALNIPEYSKYSTGIPWDEIDPLIGTMSDASVARSVGHLISTSPKSAAVFIGKRRRALNIPAYSKHSIGIPWDEIDPLLGTMSDVSVARSVGYLISTSLKSAAGSIRKRRLELKIRPYSPE